MHSNHGTSGRYLIILASLAMAYGWGYRGVVGHEGGAAVPGAILGLALCLGSGRSDWYRRSAVAGLFGAVGWAWGGSTSYMEQTMYSVTDSFPDVLYGYSILFLLGGLWAGIGGAILGLAFTLPRSALQRFVGPFVAMCLAFLVTYLILFYNHEWQDSFNRFTAEYMHDGDCFAALTVLIVCGVYAAIRPQERDEALLFVACAGAWVLGYFGLTWFGGLALAPPYRSESWGGVLGILLTLIVYLVKKQNRAALMLCLYGTVGGGLAFALAVFVRHPVRVEAWPFHTWGAAMQWKIAEEAFGLFMGLAIALGVLRLVRGGLAPAQEDVPRKPLDLFAVFVVLIALLWINLRRAPMAWIHRYNLVSPEPLAGLMAWHWFLLGGLTLSAVALYGLDLYRRDRLAIAPSSSYGKGAVVLLALIWTTLLGSFVQNASASPHVISMVDVSFVALASVVTAMVLAQRPAAHDLPVSSVLASDTRWRVGRGYAMVCAGVPVVLLAISGLSMAMQDGPVEGARLRFGEHAYWREAARIQGVWDVVGVAAAVGGEAKASDIPIRTLEFKKNREVVLINRDDSMDSQSHAWMHADSLVWLEWYARLDAHAEQESVPVRVENERMYIPWSPTESGAETYLVLERRNS